MTTAKVRFLQNNLAAADAATLTSLSAVTGYPASNVVDERRWKRTRTGGAFVVTASNRNIYFNDGADKTATIATGTYATATALCTAIVAAFTAATSANWSATWSTSTGKFTVGRSAGTAILRFSQTTNAAWTMLGYAGSIDTSAGTGLAADARRNHTSEAFTVDLGMARSVSACVLLGAAGETFPISASATLRLRASNTNNSTSEWTTYDAEYSLTRTDEIAVAFFEAASYRYWQLQWIDLTNTDGPNVEIAQFYLGDYVEPTTSDLSIGFERVLVDPTERMESESGVLFHREKTKYWSYRSLLVDYVSGDEREELERIMGELGRSVPFFISLDPDGAISADVAEFTKYVVFEDDPGRSHRFYRNFGLSFNLREVI